MSDLKTKPTNESVTAFLDSVEDEKKREDSYAVLELMREVTGEEPKMWGESLDDVDEDVLRRLVRQSVAHMRETND